MRLLVPTERDALRTNNFDAIRLGMALLVVWSHSFAIWYGNEDGEWLSRLMGGVYNSGNVAVLAFFAISGFLITLSWQNSKSWLVYLKRRVLRIHPGYLVATTLCSLIVVPLYSTRDFADVTASELWGMVSNLGLRNYIIPSDAFRAGPVNGSLWSIPFEFWCYLGVMALGMGGLAKHRIAYPVAAAALIIIRVWLDMTGRRPAGGVLEPVIGFAYFWFNVGPPFLIGGAVYLYRDLLPRCGWLLVALTALTIAMAHLPLTAPVAAVMTRSLFPFTLCYAVFYVAFEPKLPQLRAARYGDFSYGCYLYAFPIQQMLASSLRQHISFPLYVTLAMSLSLVAGMVSWHVVERWFLSTRRQERSASPASIPASEQAAAAVPQVGLN